MKKSRKSKMIMIDNEIIKLRGEVVKFTDLKDKITHCDLQIKSWEHWIKINTEEMERLENERLRSSLLIERQKKELQKNIIEKKSLENKAPKHGKSVQEMLKKVKTLQQKLKRGGINKGRNETMVFCLKCGQVKKHYVYRYSSSPLGGIGAGMSCYEGLKCSECGNELSRFDLGRIGL